MKQAQRVLSDPVPCIKSFMKEREPAQQSNMKNFNKKEVSVGLGKNNNNNSHIQEV